MKRFRIVNLLLLLLLGLAGWRTVEVWRRSVPMPPPGDTDAPKPREPMITVARRPPDPSLATRIAEKDLFDPSRQPPAAAAAPVAEQTPAPPPATLKLAGIILVGDTREAVLADTAKGKQEHRREGEEISGYRLSKIDADNVSLVGPGGEQVQLTLLIDTTRKPQGGGQAFGPGGRPTPVPAQMRPNQAARAAAQPNQGQQVSAEPAQTFPGAFGPRNGTVDRGDIERQREDARQRAQRARERLRKLRAEAARQ